MADKVELPDAAIEPHREVRPIAWLLLPAEQKSVPIYGLSPEDIKRSRKAGGLRHPQGLNTIVEHLGFEGGFGRYVREGWPRVQVFMEANGLRERADLFQGTFYYSFFLGPHGGPTHRQLADRVYLGSQPAPRRVFLGYGIDWEAVEKLHRQYGYLDPSYQENPALVSIAYRYARLQFRDTILSGQWGFLDDKLVAPPLEPVIDKTYWSGSVEKSRKEDSFNHLVEVLTIFRSLFDDDARGWVDVMPLNNSIAFLRGFDGTWDLIWRGLRQGPAPRRGVESPHLRDKPMAYQIEADFARALYLMPDVWLEREEHAAEQHFYDRGGEQIGRGSVSTEEIIRRRWMDIGLWSPQQAPVLERTPEGFVERVVLGRRLLVSPLVSIAEFQRMLQDTGYLKRRDVSGESWERANPEASGLLPVGASWNDAEAWCAWKEGQIGVQVRLPTIRESLDIRPLHAGFGHPPFVPEQTGPRMERADFQPPEAVVWSEPRYEYSESGERTRRWIKDFPPYAAWPTEIPWQEYKGLRFIDAWDTGEWCNEWQWLCGRYFVIHIGGWGAYKQIKATFRVVIDLDP